MYIDPIPFGFTAERLKQATRNTRKRETLVVARVARNQNGTLYCIHIVQDTGYSVLRSRKRRGSGKSEGSAQTSPSVHKFVSITIAHTPPSDNKKDNEP